MDKMALGMLTGGLLAAVGVGIMMNDKRTRRRVVRNGRRALRKTEHFLHGVGDLF